MLTSLTTLLALPLLTASPVTDSDLRPRWRPTKSFEFSTRFADRSRRVILKVADDAGAWAADGRLRGPAGGAELAGLEAALERWGAVRAQAALPGRRAHLEAYRSSGEARSGLELADLTQLFVLSVPEGVDTRALIADLLALDCVENAYVDPPSARQPRGDIAPPTPPFEPLQLFRGPAPVGIDADWARGGGLSGAGVGMVDVEIGWDPEHEDLSSVDLTSFVGPVINFGVEANHGTSVLGILIADDDASGVTGICPDVDMQLKTIIQPGGLFPDLLFGLLEATLLVGPGDVCLIEAQKLGPNSVAAFQAIDEDWGVVPVEYYDAEYHVTRSMTANGVHVVEPAGNGSQNLDATSSPTGFADYPAKFDASVRDSGAVLVSAGTSGPVKAGIAGTNFGSRVDAFAWGEGILTTADFAIPDDCQVFGEGLLNQDYTDCFGGTSGAAAIVAGAVAILEESYFSKFNGFYAPDELRGLLRTVGTPNVEPGRGLQPNLRGQVPRIEIGQGLRFVWLAPEILDLLQMSVIGDVNGDGWADWAGGGFDVPPEGFEVSDPGGVMMFDGASGELLFELSGGFPGARFGESIAPAGDFDEDGIDDLLIGSPGGFGAVTVHSGATGETLAQFSSGIQGEVFGAVAITVGDVDEDGVPDFAVSAPRAFADAFEIGRVELISGQTGDVLAEYNGSQVDERFGAALILVGDVDGFGLPDLAIGAPGGGSFDDPGTVQIVSLENGQVIKSLAGFESGERFGTALALQPSSDDGDSGGPLLVVGAPGAADGRGAARRFDLDGNFLGNVLSEAIGAPGDAIGAALAFTADGDDDDNQPELLVGAPGTGTEQAPESGAVYRVSMANLQVVETLLGAFEGGRFGSRVAGADLDFDGRGEVLAASFDNEEGLGGGALYHFGDTQQSFVAPPVPVLDPTAIVVNPLLTSGLPTVELQGQHLATTKRVSVAGVTVQGEGLVVTDTRLEIQLPLVPTLGAVTVVVETLGGEASTQITLVENELPTLAVLPRIELSDYLPDLEVAAPKGIDVVVAAAPGDLTLTLGSVSPVASVLPGFFALDIGNGLTELFLLSTAFSGPGGWSTLELPKLPQGVQPYTFYFQGLVFDGATLSLPGAATNVAAVDVQ
ncbi:MAG: FG-GAP-like repeat-containing protein [Planctomycetota bacterium]